MHVRHTFVLIFLLLASCGSTPTVPLGPRPVPPVVIEDLTVVPVDVSLFDGLEPGVTTKSQAQELVGPPDTSVFIDGELAWLYRVRMLDNTIRDAELRFDSNGVLTSKIVGF